MARVVRDRKDNSDVGLTTVMHAGSRTTRDCPGLSGTEGPTRTWDSQQRCMPAAGQPGTVPGCPGQKGQLGPGTHSSDACRQQDNPGLSRCPGQKGQLGPGTHSRDACRQQDNPGLSRVVRDRRANSDLGLTAVMHAGSRTTRDCPGLSGTEGPTRTWDSQQ